MAFSTAGGGARGPQMNVTPLIDVLLVLLIIFMLVVINEKPKGLDAQIPQPVPSTAKNIPPPQATIVIQVRRAPAGAEHPLVKVNEEVVEWDHLRERLRDIYAIRVERIAYIEADDDIDFQDVADVIDTARRAGVDRMGLLTEDGRHTAMSGIKV
ncbi:MAG: biopolymer transporter ExbD [Terriglobales bacterium]|jgi:biopolymer transport protein ExbD